MEIFKEIKQWSTEWFNIRAWVITWTKLKSVLWSKKVQETVMYELIAEEFAPLEDEKTSSSMQRGKELEPIAKAHYELATFQKVDEVGFIKLNDYMWLSPDGVIFDENWKIKKAVEIKCPMHKNYTKYLLEDKIPDEYLYQVLQYFLVLEDLEELDFVIFNPDFYIEEKKIKIKTVKRQDIQALIYISKPKIEEFRKAWLEKIKTLLPKK